MKYFVILFIGFSASLSMASSQSAQQGNCGPSMGLAHHLYIYFIFPPAPVIPVLPSDAISLYDGSYTLLKIESSQDGPVETYSVNYTDQGKLKNMEVELLSSSCELISISGDVPGQE